eukprot:2153748-Rhodomonas_salina.2
MPSRHKLRGWRPTSDSKKRSLDNVNELKLKLSETESVTATVSAAALGARLYTPGSIPAPLALSVSILGALPVVSPRRLLRQYRR